MGPLILHILPLSPPCNNPVAAGHAMMITGAASEIVPKPQCDQSQELLSESPLVIDFGNVWDS